MRSALITAALLGALPVLAAATDFSLPARPDTVAWGYYSGQSKPVLTVHSGDSVRMQTLSTCGTPERMIANGVKQEDIPAYTAPIYNEVKDKGPGGHILTGTRSWWPAPPCTSRWRPRAACSRRAMATPPKATAKSTSPRWRPT